MVRGMDDDMVLVVTLQIQGDVDEVARSRCLEDVARSVYFKPSGKVKVSSLKAVTVKMIRTKLQNHNIGPAALIARSSL